MVYKNQAFPYINYENKIRTYAVGVNKCINSNIKLDTNTQFSPI